MCKPDPSAVKSEIEYLFEQKTFSNTALKENSTVKIMKIWIFI